jgi:hypothetical protein
MTGIKILEKGKKKTKIRDGQPAHTSIEGEKEEVDGRSRWTER